MQFLLPSVHSVGEVPAVGAVKRKPHPAAFGAGNSQTDNADFRRLYLEQLTRSFYMENGDITGIARLAEAEVTEVSVRRENGSNRASKRFRVFFSEYNISVILEDSGGRIFANAV